MRIAASGGVARGVTDSTWWAQVYLRGNVLRNLRIIGTRRVKIIHQRGSLLVRQRLHRIYQLSKTTGRSLWTSVLTRVMLSLFRGEYNK